MEKLRSYFLDFSIHILSKLEGNVSRATSAITSTCTMADLEHLIGHIFVYIYIYMYCTYYYVLHIRTVTIAMDNAGKSFPYSCSCGICLGSEANRGRG